MIQRIQTVYLLIAALLVGLLFFVPFAEIVNGKGEIYRFDASGFFLMGTQSHEFIIGGLPVIALCVISTLFIVVTIFQYNNRAHQVTFSKLNIFMLLVLCGIIYYNVWRCLNLITGNHSLKIYLAFPLIALILIYLAIKAIRKDQELLKSIDRIR
jgi:hypothetical protein